MSFCTAGPCPKRNRARRSAGRAFTLAAGLMALTVAVPATSALAQQDLSATATLDDPRVGLAAGAGNSAEQALWNMRLTAWAPKPVEFDSIAGLSFINSDLAFRENFLYQGNFSGFMIWDIANPANPRLVSTVVCPTDQGDPTIYENLLFVSAESRRSRIDCGSQGVEDPADRMLGVRIFDVSNPASPRLVKNVQTCRGSHTNTLVPHPTNDRVVYIYVGGSSIPRDASELEGCSAGSVDENPNTAQFRVDIIRVPLDDPESAEVVGYSRMFEGLAPFGARGGPSGCHDLTSYPHYNLVAGACGSYGILLDASDPENPVRLDALPDENFSLWHTAVFSNDARTVVFTDEWGGGTRPRCRAEDPLHMGGNVHLVIDEEGRFHQRAYFKMPAAQTETENCVSHNGGLIPVPGRDIKVQGWYQGGVNVYDFTDPDNPFEIAWFDRGPVDDEVLVVGGSWGAYWYNGYIYSSELARGLDVLELLPSDLLSENEIEAAKLVTMEQYNPQAQPKLVWPAAFPVARAYLDQIIRGNGLSSARTSAIAAALDEAEAASGAQRRDRLNQIASELEAEAAGAADGERVRLMAGVIRDMASAEQ